VDWGLDPAKVRVEEYGRQAVPERAPGSSRRFPDRFAFLGQLTKYKGVDLAVRAMGLVADGAQETDEEAVTTTRAARRVAAPKPQPHLYLHGANLDLQPIEFRNELRELIETTKNVTFLGRYFAKDLPDIMSEIDWVVVPSIWWENSPLVIQEAFMYGRPVICSDIGGMAEKVTDGVNGLHFQAGSARSLANVIARAARDKDLWEKLRTAEPPNYSMDRHAATLRELYASLVSRVPA
jgi:glycosyltransferase involved in cell wall biosynthesis